MTGTRTIAGFVAMTAAAAMAAETRPDLPRMDETVPVCVAAGPGSSVLAQAEPMVSRMFAGIGVTIVWHSQGRHCPALAIQVSLTDETPDSISPGALAYAVPGQGTRIRLLYDRISENRSGKLLQCVLAHVLVHEITHILEGVCRHSDHGIMKAHWDENDFTDMVWQPLPFAGEDISLIRAGLLARTARAMFAANTTPSVALR